MTARVFIDGAAGTTGLEIAERLAGRADYTLLVLDEDRRKDTAARRDAMAVADFTILCLPDDAAREAAALAAGTATRIVDASSAHRTDPDWSYGFAEMAHGQRGRIAGAARVSNPGCYPTGVLAVLAPLVAGGLLPGDWPYAVHAVSGFSGGGKELIARFAEDGTIAWRGYALAGGHKHLAEMRVHAGLTQDPMFAPAVVPAYRGMAVELPLPLPAMPGAAPVRDIVDALAAHYRDAPLVSIETTVPDELLLRSDSPPTDRLALHLVPDAGGRLRAVALLDNLGKGASGAAVQNLNLMAGVDELAGLRL